MQADCKLGLLDIYSWVNSDEIEMFACQEAEIICPSIDFNEYVPAHAYMYMNVFKPIIHVVLDQIET